MPDLPWQGHFLMVDAARRPTWIRCVICSRSLTLPESIERGCGRDCLSQNTPAELDEARERARREDRYLWKLETGLDLPAYRFRQDLKTRKRTIQLSERQAAAVKRTGRPDPRLTYALKLLYAENPEAEARWEVLQAAKRRHAAS